MAELTYAAHMKMREFGKPNASVVMKELQDTPTRARKYRDAYKSSRQVQQRQQQLPYELIDDSRF